MKVKRGQKSERKIFAVIIIFSFIIPMALMIPPVNACESTNSPFIENISVRTASRIIRRINPLILDVRNSEDFEIGHLFNAINIPYLELEERIQELEGSKNDKIIVYCKTGITSELASELLYTLGFTKIYNMLGGIQEWLNSGYKISTTYHKITFSETSNHRTLIDINPLIKYKMDCSSCNEESGCSHSELETPQNVEITEVLNNETHLILLQNFELDGIYYESTISYITKWISTEQTDNVNRTIRFITTEISSEDFLISYDTLEYLAEYEDYKININTQLIPSEQGLYSHSFTHILLRSKNNERVLSEEFVEIKKSLKVSELYIILGMISHKISNVYKNYLRISNDVKFETLIIGYTHMTLECFRLSGIVRNSIPEYDLEILESYAVLNDPPWWVCIAASFVCGFLTGYLVTCAILAIPTAGASLAICIGSALAAVGAAWALVSTCTTFCCCLGYDVCCM